MSYEWQAEFALRFNNRQDLKDVVEGRGDFAPIGDLYARLQLLAQSVADSNWNTDAKSLSGREERPPRGGTVEIPYTYQRIALRYHDRPDRTRYTEYVARQMSEYTALGFTTPRLTEADLARLPPLSFFLYIPFTLATPYLSKDDGPFYVHENPVRKEHVLRVPLMGSTSWKGAFRTALRYHLQADDNDPRIVRLLGNSKGAEEGFRRGRLSFFPTFFDALEVGVINPHSRETSAGSQPIHIEAVPAGAHGVFALLYGPIIPSGVETPLPAWDDVLEDLKWVGEAAHTLLAETGFGAKTGSGMGRAKEEVAGAYLLVHRWIEATPALPAPPSNERPPAKFLPPDDRFLDEQGNWPLYESNTEIAAHIPGKKARSRYKRQRLAYYEWRELHRRWEEWDRQVAGLQSCAERLLVRVDLSRLEALKTLDERVKQQVQEGDNG